jgi:hypothetical protein
MNSEFLGNKRRKVWHLWRSVRQGEKARNGRYICPQYNNPDVHTRHCHGCADTAGGQSRGNFPVPHVLAKHLWGKGSLFYKISSILLNSYYFTETENCFETLKIIDGSDHWVLNPNRKGVVGITVQLPHDKTCDKCILRWHWKSGPFLKYSLMNAFSI